MNYIIDMFSDFALVYKRQHVSAAEFCIFRGLSKWLQKLFEINRFEVTFWRLFREDGKI